MRIVFFGTPDYILPVLNLIQKRFSHRGISPIVAIVTQPPRPVGRKQILLYSTVDTWAFKKEIPVFHKAEKILEENLEADLGILASYGAIISKDVIDSFPFGIINIHPSLLPKWRGASPVQAPIITGEKETGVSIIKLDEKLDHGPIVAQFKEKVFENDTTETLRARLFERSAQVLVDLLEPYLKRKITAGDQNHKGASFTTQIKKEDAFIEPKYLNAALQGQSLKNKWEIRFLKDFPLVPGAESLERFIRAMNPWPVAWTYVKITSEASPKRLKILTAHIEEAKLVPDKVQLEGKDPVSWKQFMEAYTEATFAE